jgi:hypothetical protein
MNWELVGTWAAIAFSIIGGIYKMGRQAQRIDGQEDAIAELKQKVEASKEVPIKLATLETDVKYLIEGIRELKQLILHNKGIE